MITNTKFRQQNKTNKAKKTLIVGIDLLWVRPNKVGGTESYIRNLLQGFKFYSPDGFFFMLFVSKDNIESFQEYIEKPNFKIIKCEIKSSNIVMRILWENIYLDKFAVKHNVDVMFIPVYSMPLKNSSIPYVVTIHDLQALHYPEYFSKLKNIWMRCSWKHTIKKANKIIAISNFVKEDIHRNLRGPLEKIQVIYNPVSVTDIYEDYGTILNQYGIQKRGYFYTISSLLPHKNTEVLIKILLNIKQEAQSEMPRKLVISGIKGTRAEFLNNLSKKLGVSENIIYTGFISNQIRNILYQNSYAFLFPSTFEGFGMPPVEAMMLGTPVVTTQCASIPEVTQNKCLYVKNPRSEKEWFNAIKQIRDNMRVKHFFPKYELKFATEQTLKVLSEGVNFDI